MKNLLNNLSKSTLINMIEELSKNATTDSKYIRYLQEEVMTAEQIARDLQEDNDYFDTALARAYEQIAKLTTPVQEEIDMQYIRHLEREANDEIPNLSWIDQGEEYYEKMAEQSIRDYYDDVPF